MKDYSKYFSQASINVFEFSFSANGKRCIGCLYYVHHDLGIFKHEFNGEKIQNQVKEGLEKHGCREANIEDLKAFFETYKELLSQFDFYVILATEEASQLKSELVPAIAKINSLEACLVSLKVESGILWGHTSIYVLGVKVK